MKGLAKSELDETMDMYMVLKKLHGSTNTKFKKMRTPDWVYEELQSARVEFQLSQTIEKLYDHLETSKIEIATLNQQAQSTLHTQNEELEGLKTRLITTEAEKESAQSQALHLHNESERKRQELELALRMLQTQSDELDRLNAHVITLEAQRNSAQSQALIESARARKSVEALSAVSVELADKIAERNLAHSKLEKNEIESKSIRSSRGYRLISKYWKIKASFKSFGIEKV